MKFNLKGIEGASTFLSVLRNRSQGDYMNPLRDWTIGLFVAVFIFLIGVLFIGYDFYTQFGGQTQEIVLDEQPIVYRDKEVRTFAEIYSTKEKTFNALRSNQKYIPPPPQESSSTPPEIIPEPLADTPTTE